MLSLERRLSSGTMSAEGSWYRRPSPVAEEREQESSEAEDAPWARGAEGAGAGFAKGSPAAGDADTGPDGSTRPSTGNSSPVAIPPERAAAPAEDFYMGANGGGDNGFLANMPTRPLTPPAGSDFLTLRARFSNVISAASTDTQYR
jgi:hypothetical protein